jgi:anaerobic selenocysteine-containing dehydrogenase
MLHDIAEKKGVHMTQPSLIPTICPYCGVGCGLYVAVEDGRAVGLEYMS